MKISVIGSTSDRQAINIFDAVQFYADVLIPEDIQKNLHIEVELDDELDNLGYTSAEKRLGRPPKSFSISINPSSREGIYRTLAHEMVHVKQYAMGELEDQNIIRDGGFRHMCKWKGNLLISHDANSIQYYDNPWEIEAYGLEVGLYAKWRNRKLLTI